MALSRQQSRSEHTQATLARPGSSSETANAAFAGHEQFTETIYGVICSTCHNYILIDKTNCPSNCREHESCRQAYV